VEIPGKQSTIVRTKKELKVNHNHMMN